MKYIVAALLLTINSVSLGSADAHYTVESILSPVYKYKVILEGEDKPISYKTYIIMLKEQKPSTVNWCIDKVIYARGLISARAMGESPAEFLEMLSMLDKRSYLAVDMKRMVRDIFRKSGDRYRLKFNDVKSKDRFVNNELMACLVQHF